MRCALAAIDDFGNAQSTKQVPTTRTVEMLPRVAAVSPEHSPKQEYGAFSDLL
jgi:hypothetical protein